MLGRLDGIARVGREGKIMQMRMDKTDARRDTQGLLQHRHVDRQTDRQTKKHTYVFVCKTSIHLEAALQHFSALGWELLHSSLLATKRVAVGACMVVVVFFFSASSFA